MNKLKYYVIAGMLFASLGATVQMYAMEGDQESVRAVGYESEEESKQSVEEREYEPMHPTESLRRLCTNPEVSLEAIIDVVNRGADVNGVLNGIFSHASPLHLALWMGREDVVRLLLDNHAAVEHTDSNGNTPLAVAVSLGLEAQDAERKNCYVKMIGMLLERGATVSHEMLSHVSRTENDDNCVITKALFRFGTSKSFVFSHDQDYFYWQFSRIIKGAILHDEPLFAVLLERYVNSIPEYALKGLTLMATQCGKKEALELLMDTFVLNVNCMEEEDAARYSLLPCAARYRRVGIVQMLLDKGADLELKDHEEWSALMRATYEGHAQIIEMLLEHGAIPLLAEELAECPPECQSAYRAVQESIEQRRQCVSAVLGGDSKANGFLLSELSPLVEEYAGLRRCEKQGAEKFNNVPTAFGGAQKDNE